MAAADEQNPDKKDLRFTKHVDQGVSIERDLSGSGHLARGSHTRMSQINISVRGKSRDYLDPHLAVLHEPPAPRKVPRPVGDAVAESSHAAASPPSVGATPAPADARQSVFVRLANAIRRMLPGS